MHCDECGIDIYGRSDKRFCSDQCRAAYHNKFLKKDMREIRSTNRILRKNRRLLQHLSSKFEEIELSRLYDMGFREGYVTRIDKTSEGEVHYFCYDQGFAIFDEQRIKILKQVS